MGGFSELGINMPLLVAFVINFLILFGLLTLVLYKPVLRMLDERSNRIKESMDRAEATKAEYAHAQEEVAKQLNQAREEGRAMVSQAAQVAERVKEEAKEEARREAEAIVGRVRIELEEERDKALGELRKEFVDISIAAAEKVISESLDKEANRKLIEDVLDKSSTFGRG